MKINPLFQKTFVLKKHSTFTDTYTRFCTHTRKETGLFYFKSRALQLNCTFSKCGIATKFRKNSCRPFPHAENNQQKTIYISSVNTGSDSCDQTSVHLHEETEKRTCAGTVRGPGDCAHRFLQELLDRAMRVSRARTCMGVWGLSISSVRLGSWDH